MTHFHTLKNTVLAAITIFSLAAISACGSDDDPKAPTPDAAFITPSTFRGTSHVVTLTSTAGNEGFQYNSSATSYTLTFDLVGNTVSILCNQAQWAPNMPALNITFPDIPVVIEGSTFTLATSSLVPVMGGDPYPAIGVTDVRGTGTIGSTALLDLHFTVAVPFTGETYQVTATSLHP